MWPYLTECFIRKAKVIRLGICRHASHTNASEMRSRGGSEPALALRPCSQPRRYCSRRRHVPPRSTLRTTAAALWPHRGSAYRHVDGTGRGRRHDLALSATFGRSCTSSILPPFRSHLPPLLSLSTLHAWVGSSAAATSPSTLTARSTSSTSTSTVPSAKALSARYVLASLPRLGFINGALGPRRRTQAQQEALRPEVYRQGEVHKAEGRRKHHSGTEAT